MGMDGINTLMMISRYSLIRVVVMKKSLRTVCDIQEYPSEVDRASRCCFPARPLQLSRTAK